MKIRTKLLTGFGVILVLIAIVTSTGIIQLDNTTLDYTYVMDYPIERRKLSKDMNTYVADMQRAAISVAIYIGDSTKLAETEKQLNNALAKADQAIEKYIENVNSDKYIDAQKKKERLDGINRFDNVTDRYFTEIGYGTLRAAQTGDLNGVHTIIDNGASLIDEVNRSAQDLATMADQLTNTIRTTTKASSDNSLILLSVISSGSIMLGIAIALMMASLISKPIKELVEIAENVCSGRLNVNIRNKAKDETGLLSQSFSKLLDVFNSLIYDLESMSQSHDNGEIDEFLDPNKFEGEFSIVAHAVNNMVTVHIQVNKKAIDTISAIVDGNFNANMDKLPGKKVFINNAIDNLRFSIRGISSEIDELVANSIKGNLSFKIDSKKYKGDWVKLMDGLNSVMSAVSEPTIEIQQVMVRMAQGDFTRKMNGTYHGDYDSIKASVNTTIAEISSYISEVSTTLAIISKGDLTKSITRDYVGSFFDIKDSINTIVSSLHNTMSNIASASSQVLAGAKQISTSSMDLARGASIQASSVQQLNASVDLINQQTRENANSAIQANELSLKSTDNAKQGNQEMKDMLSSMTGIKQSSNNISKIIKVIDDIAFQTNLLALNAAVESARAGEHGKGFAVVAEEVRNLAGRSLSAARETTGMIEDSIQRVDSGTKTAQSTAGSLDIIVSNVREVSDIISNISKSSNEQATAVEQISIGLSQISAVVQSNSSTSEETAAASQELTSQAEMLTQMVSFFKL